MNKFRTWLHRKLNVHYWNLEIGETNWKHKRECRICGKKQRSCSVGKDEFYWEDVKL